MHQQQKPGPPDPYQMLRLYLRAQIQAAVDPPLGKAAEYLLVPPDLLHLLTRLLLDESVPMREKAKIGLALAYFVSPLNLIPDFLLSPVGLIDDIAIGLYVLDALLNQTDPTTVEQCWAGERETIQWVQITSNQLNNFMGGGFLRRLDPILAWLFP